MTYMYFLGPRGTLPVAVTATVVRSKGYYSVAVCTLVVVAPNLCGSFAFNLGSVL